MSDYIQKGSRNYRQAVAAIFLGGITAMMTEYCVQPIIPVFAREFHLSPSVASLVVSFGTGGMALAMLLIAVWAGRLNRKRTMSAALLTSALLILLMAVTTDFNTILVLRLLQGMILASYPALMVAYICEEFSPAIVGLVTGFYISGNSMGGLLGRLVLSALTDWFSWRIGLGALGVFCLLTGIAFFLALPKSRHHVPAKSDSAGIMPLLFASLINPRLVKVYSIGAILAGTFTALYNYIAFPLMAPPYNLSQAAVGSVFLVFVLGFFTSPLSGAMSDRFGTGRVLALSLLLMLAGCAVTLLPGLAAMITGLAIFTLGYFAALPIAASLAGRGVAGDKAQGSALYFLFFYTGFSVIGTVGGIFFAANGWPGLIVMEAALLAAGLALTWKMDRA